MNRVWKVNHPGMEAYAFRCPGCGMDHMVPVSHTPDYEKSLKERGFGAPNWTWNSSMERPTFSPSLLVKWHYNMESDKKEEGICHSFINDGRIQFLGDCTHKLKGQTVELAEVKG